MWCPNNFRVSFAPPLPPSLSYWSVINNVSPHSYHSLPGSRRLRIPPQAPLRSSCSSLPSFLRYPRTDIILAGMILMMRLRMMRMRMRMEMGALKIGDCRKSSQASQFYFSDGANCFLPVPQLAPKWLKPEKSNLETVQRQNSPF